MKNFWNERYSEKEYIYGEEPNIFFAEQLKNIKPGKIILPCEGEGRNAVYAASCGWEVNAFDSSEAGKTKALQLAAVKGVSINYTVDDATTITYAANSVDVVAFIYAHFPSNIRKQIHQKAITWLKPGGKIILEAFNPQQLQNNSGGPKELSMLYTEDMMKEDFASLNIELIKNLTTELSEGKYHEGKASIIRVVGIKL
jgi:ubiquinone/menaquinone biosynthesis C-methylase UbiE